MRQSGVVADLRVGKQRPLRVIASDQPRGDHADLKVTTSVNGEVREQATLGDLIFDVPTFIEAISARCEYPTPRDCATNRIGSDAHGEAGESSSPCTSTTSQRSRNFGISEKIGKPRLYVDSDTLVGTLDYGSLRVTTATMGYKHQPLDIENARAEIAARSFMLKV